MPRRHRRLFPAFFTSLAMAKGPCEDYFGPVDQHGLATTVLDPDVKLGFPYGTLSKVHHAGPGTICAPPGPPNGCHRYYVANYAPKQCPSACPLVDGSAKELAGQLDTSNAFDRATGILSSCAACVESVKMVCWGAPADEPVKCACPGAEWMSAAHTEPTAATSFSSPLVLLLVVAAAAAGYMMRRLTATRATYQQHQAI